MILLGIIKNKKMSEHRVHLGDGEIKMMDTQVV